MIFSQPLPLVASRISQHDFLLDALATDPSAGLPLGNGGLSASLYGGPGHLSLSVRKGDVHVGEIGLQIKCEVRSAKCEEQHSNFELRTSNFAVNAVNRSEGLPRFPVLLRLYDATARVTLPDGVEIEAFVAATRSLIVLRVRSQRAAPLPAALELRSAKCVSGTQELRKTVPDFLSSRFDLRPSTFDCDGPFRYLRRDLSAGLSAVLCGLVYGARSRAAVREDALLATFDAPPSGECLILIGVATSPDGPDPARSARAEVERALPHGYLLLQREHAVWWERFWSQVEGSEHINYRDIYCSRVAGCDS